MPGSLRRMLHGGRLLVAALIAALLTGTLAVVWGSPAIESTDHWTGDIRARMQARDVAGEHDKITLVLIQEPLMEAELVRSPLRRDLIAAILTNTAAAKPRAIGLDIIIDQKGQGDEALIRAIRAATASGTPVVLTNIIPNVTSPNLPKRRLDAQAAFIEAAGQPPVGHPYLFVERDGVVRTRIPPGGAFEERDSFAAVLARAGGASDASLARFAAPDTARRIDWLRRPNGMAPFPIVPASLLAGDAFDPTGPTAALLRDRIVIVGVDLDDVDRHRTPLTADVKRTLPGAEVHAHILAQILDNRHRTLLPLLPAFALTFVTAVVGILIGWTWDRAALLASTALLIPYFVLDHLLVTRVGLVVPFIIPLLAWGGGILVGEAMRASGTFIGRLRGRRNPLDTTMETG
jgi:adenylate cyclase